MRYTSGHSSTGKTEGHMAIHELSEEECRALLARASMGRLGCSLDNQPYVVPIRFAYEPDYLYVFATFGKKIEWMRVNPKVCVEIDEIETISQWISVIVDGYYQELSEPKYAAERSHARELLEKQHQWWMNALGERQLKSSKELLIDPLFFRVQIGSMTGLRALDAG